MLLLPVLLGLLSCILIEVNTSINIMKRSFSQVDESSDDGWVEGSEIKRNHLFLEGDITQESTTELISEIDRVSYDIIKMQFSYDIKELPIYLHINSRGGDVHQAFRIVDKILKNPIKVITIADGYVASAATFILIVGHQRWSTLHSYFLIHELSTGHEGKLRDLKDSVRNCKRIDKRISALYIKYTTIPENRLVSKLKKEREFDVDEALSLGFIDTIL